MASTSTALVHVDKPFHPPSSFRFPTQKYGLRDRSCQHSWFSEFDFDIESDALFCHTCQRAVREEKIRSSKGPDQAFVSLV